MIFIHQAHWIRGVERRGVRHPSALIFKQREQQTRIDRIVARHDPHDFIARERNSIYVLLIRFEISILTFDKFLNVKICARGTIHHFRIWDDLEIASNAHRIWRGNIETHAHFKQVRVRDVIRRHQRFNADAIILRDQPKRISRLHDVLRRILSRSGEDARRVRRGRVWRNRACRRRQNA